VLIPVREASRLRTAFPDAVCLALGTVGVPADAIEQERAQMSEVAFGSASNRSLRGSLTDFSFLARTRFITARDGPLEKIARDLAGDAADSAFRWSAAKRSHAQAVWCRLTQTLTRAGYPTLRPAICGSDGARQGFPPLAPQRAGIRAPGTPPIVCAARP
jgi:hypothetical protein